MFKRHQSLRVRLVWSALLCIVIPLLIIYMVTNYITKDIIVEKVISNAQDSLKAARTEINGIMEQSLEMSNFVLMNNEIRQLLMKSGEGLGTEEQRKSYALDYSRLSRILDDLFLTGTDVYVTILGTNAPFYTNYSYSDYNPSLFYDRSWLQQVGDMRLYSALWLGESGLRNKADHSVTLARPIKSATSRAMGYMIVQTNEQVIRSYLKRDDGEEMMLLDARGVVISHPDAARIGKKMEWWSAEDDAQTVRIDDESYIVVRQPLSINSWHVVHLIPLEAEIKENREILMISFLLQVLFFTLFFLLLTIRISSITKPIAELSKFVMGIGRGQLDARNNIREPNEVGQLARTIDYMLDRIQAMIEQITVEQTKQRKAELEMLQAQINPHFMFNLLNSIRMNILMEGDKQNAELIGSLSSLLRTTFNRDSEFVPLREEVDTLRHYVLLMNFRHANQVKLHDRLEEGCGQMQVPRFMIQPLIENAIIHGFEQYDGDIHIEAGIEAKEDKSFLRIVVRDNGIGMSAQKLEELKGNIESEREPEERFTNSFSGIGVMNVFQRLRLIYGAEFMYGMESEPGVGTTIELWLPIDTNGGERIVDGDTGR